MIKKINKDKKGIVLPATVRIIISVLVISGLLYLAFGLYGIITVKSGIEQAEGTLEELITKINLLEDGQSVTVLLLAPDKWYVNFFEKNECESDVIGDFNGCACVCPGKTADSCSLSGVCMGLDEEIKPTEIFVYGERFTGSIYLNGPRAATFSKEGEVIKTKLNKVVETQEDKEEAEEIKEISEELKNILRTEVEYNGEKTTVLDVIYVPLDLEKEIKSVRRSTNGIYDVDTSLYDVLEDSRSKSTESAPDSDRTLFVSNGEHKLKLRNLYGFEEKDLERVRVEAENAGEFLKDEIEKLCKDYHFLTYDSYINAGIVKSRSSAGSIFADNSNNDLFLTKTLTQLKERDGVEFSILYRRAKTC